MRCGGKLSVEIPWCYISRSLAVLAASTSDRSVSPHFLHTFVLSELSKRYSGHTIGGSHKADLIRNDENEERLCRIWIQYEASGWFESELIRIWDDSALITQDKNRLAGSIMNCQYYLWVKETSSSLSVILKAI